MLITSLCASRSGWLPASPNGKVYCIPHKPPAHGGGLWGLRTAPYSPPLFFFALQKKQGRVRRPPARSHPGGNGLPRPEAHPTFSYGKSEGELLTARPTAPAWRPWRQPLFFAKQKKGLVRGAFGLLLIFHPCAAAALPCPPPADRGRSRPAALQENKETGRTRASSRPFGLRRRPKGRGFA